MGISKVRGPPGGVQGMGGSGRVMGLMCLQDAEEPGRYVMCYQFLYKESCSHGTLVMEGILEIKSSRLFSLQPIKLKPKEIPLRSHGSIVTELGINNPSSIKYTIFEY